MSAEDGTPSEPPSDARLAVTGTTTRQQAAWARAHLPRTSFNLEGGAPSVIGPTLEQLVRLAHIYPEVMARIELFYLDDLPTGSVGGLDVFGRSQGALPGQPSSLVLNRAYFSRPGRLVQRLGRSTRVGWHPSGTDQIGSVVTHEFGHHLWFFLEEEGFDPRGFMTTLAEDRRSLSLYAERDRTGEAWAEAFAAYYLGDEAARSHPLTRSVVQFVERSMRTLRERRSPS